VVTPKKKQKMSNCTHCSNQEERQQNACTHDQRSDSHWRHQSASHKLSRKHEF